MGTTYNKIVEMESLLQRGKIKDFSYDGWVYDGSEWKPYQEWIKNVHSNQDPRIDNSTITGESYFNPTQRFDS